MPARLERLAARVEHAHRERAEAGGGRDRAALVHEPRERRAPGRGSAWRPRGGVLRRGCRGRRPAARRRCPSTSAQHVVLGHLAAAAGALDAGEVDAVGVGDAVGDGRGVGVAVAGWRSLRCGPARRLGRRLGRGAPAARSRRAGCARRSCPTARSRRARPGSRRRAGHGRGISASTLSVEISTSSRPRRPASPTCLCHSRTVPSWTDSPICGSTTSTSSPAGAAARPASWRRRGPSRSRAGSLRSAPLSSPRWSRRPRRRPPAARAPGCAPFGVDLAEHRARRGRSRRPRRGSGRACRRPGRAPRRRPCRSRPRAASRSARPASPTCLSHSRTVPSVTDSPIWGMVICTVVPVPSRPLNLTYPREGAHARRARLRPWTGGSSTGAGATRTSSPPPEQVREAAARAARAPRVRRGRGRAAGPARGASSCAPPRLELAGRARRDRARPTPYARASHALGQGLPRRRARLPRAVRRPARRRAAPARRGRARARARLGLLGRTSR